MKNDKIPEKIMQTNNMVGRKGKHIKINIPQKGKEPFFVIRCFGCDLPLLEPGALIFSPPNKRGECTKVHVCVPCWENGVVVQSCVPYK